MKTLALLSTLLLAGCAYNPKPRHLPAGMVTRSTSSAVVLDWPYAKRYSCGHDTLCIGEFVHHVCPETLPMVGAEVNGVDLTWQPARKCWKWESR